MLKRLGRWIMCNIFYIHVWTSEAMDGSLNMGIDKKDCIFANMFLRHVRMYCKHCGVESKVSEEFRKNYLRRG
jgi:hypothetical protein